MTKRLTLYKDAANQWRWTVKSSNGRIVADSSEGYEHRADCIKQAIDLFGSTVVYELDSDEESSKYIVGERGPEVFRPDES